MSYLKVGVCFSQLAFIKSAFTFENIRRENNPLNTLLLLNIDAPPFI